MPIDALLCRFIGHLNKPASLLGDFVHVTLPRHGRILGLAGTEVKTMTASVVCGGRRGVVVGRRGEVKVGFVAGPGDLDLRPGCHHSMIVTRQSL